jgi:hypothetical protein
LDEYSGFSQIPVHKDDQGKTTLTFLFGTFTYRRMPFGLCNAPTTFQRCMNAIFTDYIEKIMEVFMDDFLCMVLHLITVYSILIKFCGDAWINIKFSIGRSVTLW